MSDSRPCGCDNATVCPQHATLLPAGERIAHRCRNGVHRRNCPKTCPLKTSRATTEETAR